MKPSTKPFPREIQQAGPRELRITWNDGHVSSYPVLFLRCSCRCAGCVDEMSGLPILDPARVPEDVKPTEISPVGRYALKILWTDGHDSSIYTFDHLRKICPCAECRAKKG